MQNLMISDNDKNKLRRITMSIILFVLMGLILVYIIVNLLLS